MAAATRRIVRRSERVLMPTYARAPLAPVRGRGAWLWDVEGRRYLDFVGGLGVASLGHCPPSVVRAVRRQAGALLHVPNLYQIEPQTRLAEALVRKTFPARVFFANSGAEANEAALKLARKYGHEALGGRFEVLTTLGSFHGRTLATVTATGQEKFHVGFQPLMPGFRYVPFGDAEAMERAIGAATCALLVEPVQGEGGVHLPPPDYLPRLRALCDRQHLLLIFDEVQVGLGRLGKLFAYQAFGVRPDLLTLAKGLAGGVPIGALIARAEVARHLGPGSHGSTFGGNPLAATAGLAAFRELCRPALHAHVRKMGERFRRTLDRLREEYPAVREVRGMGLLWAIELDREAAPVAEAARRAGLLVNVTGGRILRFLPPLVVGPAEIDRAGRILRRAFREALA